MFNFFRKKSKKEIENINSFNDAIKAIKYFIATLEWEKAKKAIEEIRQKEMHAYKEITNDIDIDSRNPEIQKEKERVNKFFSQKKDKLDKLESYLEKKKTEYEEKLKKQKFEAEFKILKKEVRNLSHTGNTHSAIKLIKSFLEEHKGNTKAIKYYNKQKKILDRLLKKQEKQKEKKLKQNAKLEALKLIGKEVKTSVAKKDKKKKKGFFSELKEKIDIYKLIKQKLEEKRLLKEVEILLSQEDKVKQQIANTKLANIHKGLIKEINENILGYDIYGKILGAHKISGDTFGFKELKRKYVFFIGDATGHGIRAGFIVTLITRLFNKYVEKKSFRELVMEINNSLKQDLKSMNFITSIFFEIFKDNLDIINFIGLGHEPILVYRKETKQVEMLRPGGLAAGIRIIKDIANIKIKRIKLENGDILLTYSDGLLEAKSPEGKYYGLDRLKEQFKKIADSTISNTEIYNFLVKDVSDFRGGTQFDDDLTIMILRRNYDKDIVKDAKNYLEELGEVSNIEESDIKKLKGKTKVEILEELEELKKKKETKMIVRKLKQLWLSGEILKLKEDAKEYIKKGYVDPQINYYFKKAIEKQQAYKISLKEERMRNKYNTLKELLKKGDYDTVIDEAQDIILKDGNI